MDTALPTGGQHNHFMLISFWEVLNLSRYSAIGIPIHSEEFDLLFHREAILESVAGCYVEQPVRRGQLLEAAR